MAHAFKNWLDVQLKLFRVRSVASSVVQHWPGMHEALSLEEKERKRKKLLLKNTHNFTKIFLGSKLRRKYDWE